MTPTERTSERMSSPPASPEESKRASRAETLEAQVDTSELAGTVRVVIERVSPQVDAGRFPVKRTVGDDVVVDADVFADGHDELACVLRYKRERDATWAEVPMSVAGKDLWRGSFQVTEAGRWLYTVRAWVDHFATWTRDLAKRIEAGQDVGVELLVGARLVREVAERARGDDANQLSVWAQELGEEVSASTRIELALGAQLAHLVSRYPDVANAVDFERELPIVVDRERARFSTWYELFPRSCAPQPGRHGTLRDVESRLPDLARLGFDVLYLPPIHPIGRKHRKGQNNATTAAPTDPGSPWAIGALEGGHKAIHPELGTLEDFEHLVAAAREHGLEVALDIAFQCAPDHPYVSEHPEWFRQRPDGSVQYAENPPKKYQDIYPFDFETKDWRALWNELRSVVEFWVTRGVRIFRVDNPHTKSFRFWEWLISTIKEKHSDVLFLAEAFTRPKVMYRLAKLGFTQSYTYFTWRNTKEELTTYLQELTQTPVREFFRPNFWPNTPDILTEHLQYGGRPAFMARLTLAATLTASYGVYGPAYELCVSQAREPGSEEYLDSEKYEIRNWDLKQPGNIRDFMARINKIRRENTALHSDWSLRFHPVDNDQVLCYSKNTSSFDDVVLVVVNLDPHHQQSGWVELPLEELRIDAHQPYQMHDLLSGARYMWSGSRNFVQLDPQQSPAHVFRVLRRVRREQDFEYFF